MYYLVQTSVPFKSKSEARRFIERLERSGFFASDEIKLTELMVDSLPTQARDEEDEIEFVEHETRIGKLKI